MSSLHLDVYKVASSSNCLSSVYLCMYGVMCGCVMVGHTKSMYISAIGNAVYFTRERERERERVRVGEREKEKETLKCLEIENENRLGVIL